MSHQDVIATIVNELKDMSAIRALFLSGSYGNGFAKNFAT